MRHRRPTEATGVKIEENVPLAPLTYYKIGGPARFFARPENLEDLKIISSFIKKNTPSVFILGAGSNLLISDEGFDGLIIHASKLNTRLELLENDIVVGASVMVIALLRTCMKKGIKGLEMLVGIPGNMGGVFCMNAGAGHEKINGEINRGINREIKDVLTELTLFDLASEKIRILKTGELPTSYRKNHFLKSSEIILEGRLRITHGKAAEVQSNITALLNQRKQSQPIDKPSCGSVFKNPKNGAQAWKLIADAGLRGHRIGNAEISAMHTNFIVNLGGASAKDVLALINLAKTRVKEKFGIELEEEVIFVS